MFNLLANHALFGTKHLIIIGVCIALVVVLFIFSRKMSFTALCKTMFYVGIVSETIKIFYYIIQNTDNYGGLLPKTDLPFHLCSIQILFICVLNFSKNEKVKRFLLSFMYPSCLLGGIAAILIATDSSRNGMWIITAQYFLYHVALIILALNIGTRKELGLKTTDYFNCLKFLGVLLFVAVYINSMIFETVPVYEVNEAGEYVFLGTKIVTGNFMYVVSPPQDGLPFLTEKYGWGVYIAHYAGTILICVTLCYIKPIITGIKEKIAKKGQVKLEPATHSAQPATEVESEVASAKDE